MTLAAFAVAATMNAQVYVGGGLGFETSSQDGNSTTAFKFLPEIGYNLDENWAVGIVFGYSQTELNDDVDDEGKVQKVKNKKFQISPYARYTFLKLDKVNVFIDGGLDYIHADNGGSKNNTFAIGVKPGVAVNLNDKLSFVSHFGWLGYKNSKDDYEGAKAVNTFGLNLDSNVSFGLYYNF